MGNGYSPFPPLGEWGNEEWPVLAGASRAVEHAIHVANEHLFLQPIARAQPLNVYAPHHGRTALTLEETFDELGRLYTHK